MKELIFVLMPVIMILLAVNAKAVPAVPSAFWGTATIDGSPAQNGLIVTAEINGVNYAQPSATKNGYYNVIVKGDDTSTLQKEGGVNGETVTIKINGLFGKNVTWYSSLVKREDITITTMPCTVPTDDMNITTDTIFCPGIYSLPNGVNVIANNILLNCNNAQLTGTGTYGVDVHNRNNVTVKNCKLSGYNMGIGVYSTTNSSITSNLVSGGQYGIRVFGSSGNEFKKNNATTHIQSCFSIISTSTNNNFVQNDLRNCNWGIYLTATSSGNSFSGNTITQNVEGLNIRLNSLNTYFHYNNIYSNTNYNIYNAQSQDLDATNNWWGTTNSATIASLIYDRYDDATKGYVIYNPWLTSPYVPVDEFISITITGGNPDFGNENPGTENTPSVNNPLTIKINPETNVNVDVFLKGNNFAGAGIINISNVKYDDDSVINESVETGLNKKNMSNSYQNPYFTNILPGTNNTVYFFISIPGGQTSGSYSSNFYVSAVKQSTIP